MPSTRQRPIPSWWPKFRRRPKPAVIAPEPWPPMELRPPWDDMERLSQVETGGRGDMGVKSYSLKSANRKPTLSRFFTG